MKGHASREHADATRGSRFPDSVLRSTEYSEHSLNLTGNFSGTVPIAFNVAGALNFNVAGPALFIPSVAATTCAANGLTIASGWSVNA